MNRPMDLDDMQAHREHQEFVEQQAYEAWVEETVEDDPDADVSVEAFANWCVEQAEARDERLAEAHRNGGRGYY